MEVKLKLVKHFIMYTLEVNQFYMLSVQRNEFMYYQITSSLIDDPWNRKPSLPIRFKIGLSLITMKASSLLDQDFCTFSHVDDNLELFQIPVC